MKRFLVIILGFLFGLGLAWLVPNGQTSDRASADSVYSSLAVEMPAIPAWELDSLAWPLPGSMTSYSTDHPLWQFGDRCRTSSSGVHKCQFHNGFDIPAKVGTPVLAPEAGVITSARLARSGGACGGGVTVTGRTGRIHVFCHLIDRPREELQALEGQEVEAGDVVGTVGMTGDTTGAHLHWGLKVDNVWADPKAAYLG